MKIFITGGTGFIGKHLITKLSKNKENKMLILCRSLEQNNFFDSPNIKLIKGSLSNINEWEEKVREFNPEAAIHLAWEGIPDYKCEVSLKNLKYGLDLFSMLTKIGCKKIIATGSCWEYGKQKGSLNEENIINPHNVFTSAKSSLHWAGKYLAEENNISFIWLRLFYVYGHGQRNNSLIPYIIDCIKENKIPDVKTPSAKNDFVYVEDVADAIIAILEKVNNSAIYNIGSGYLTSVKEIINIVCANLNIKCDFKSSKSTEEVLYDGFWGDISKIRRETGWDTKVGIKEGILKMIISCE